MNTSLPSWPLFLEKTLYDVWGNVEQSTETIIATLEHFARRWGGFDTEAFQRALEGESNDRLFALFALGYMVPGPMTERVRHFLHSPVAKERWASTITLGRWKQEEVLPSLITLLQEGLLFTPPEKRSGSEEQANSWWDREEVRYADEYEWYRLQRQHVAIILGSWQHSLIVPALIRAFNACYHLEFHSPVVKTHPYLAGNWQTFQDYLAYALGQQGAWDVLERLALPVERLHILRMFMVYGALHAKASCVLAGAWYLSYEEMGISEPALVDKALQEYFYLSPEVCVTFYRDFYQYCTRREEIPYPISGEV